MKVIKGKLDGILIIEPDIFEDPRGFFLESYNRSKYSEIGIKEEFIQDNHSLSIKGTLRGLHFQLPQNPQVKLVRVTAGEVFDVVVDVRKNSPTFGKWESFILSAKNKKQIYVPLGFAHGFCVISDRAEFLYKCSSYYSPKDERAFAWNDPDVGIKWPVDAPILSKRDQLHPFLKDLKIEDLF